MAQATCFVIISKTRREITLLPCYLRQVGLAPSDALPQGHPVLWEPPSWNGAHELGWGKPWKVDRKEHQDKCPLIPALENGAGEGALTLPFAVYGRNGRDSSARPPGVKDTSPAALRTRLTTPGHQSSQGREHQPGLAHGLLERAKLGTGTKGEAGDKGECDMGVGSGTRVCVFVEWGAGGAS